jgi:arsenate reductase
MKKMNILFVCVHNSARSQMAEAFMKQFGGAWYEVFSAGLSPGILNQDVVRAMQEIGIDISGNRTKGIEEILGEGRRFDIVVTVCDEAHAEQCPVIPGAQKRIHWSVEDPSAVVGPEEERMMKIRKIRDEIKELVMQLLRELPGK